MGLDDAYKRKQEEESNIANREAEQAWEDLDETVHKQGMHPDQVGTIALVAIAAELRAARKAKVLKWD